MKIKLSVIVAITITSLNAEIINKYVFTNPLPANFKAIDNGGTKAAIDAYKDGVGVVVLDNLGQNIQIDNSAMNTLVYKYGEEAKANNTTIVDEVMYGSGSTNTKDKVLVGNLTIDGASCNDQNAATQGETWLSGNCQGGINTNGTPCNDGEPKTINDIYTNNICAGINVEGQACSDDNFLTIQDKYLNGVCTGTLTANGQTCNDDNIMTVNDVYTNGVCAGTLTVNSQSCNDGLVMTVNDIYTNGVCAGTLTVNGTTCTHSDVKVVNETWLNGVCTGTLTVNGATCTHSDVKVVNETWLNGVCTGTLTVNGATCTHSDPKVINETWLNGVCTGTLTVNGATCTHSDVKVVNETWLNGVCTGTLTVNGQSCNDGNAQTINDIYTNGVCSGTIVQDGTSILTNLYNKTTSNVAFGIYNVASNEEFVVSNANTIYNFNNSYFKITRNSGFLSIFGSSCMKNNITIKNLNIRALGDSWSIFTTHPYIDGYYGSESNSHYLENVIVDASQLSYSYVSYLNGPMVYCTNTTIILPAGKIYNQYANYGGMIGCNFIQSNTAEAQAIISNMNNYIK